MNSVYNNWRVLVVVSIFKALKMGHYFSQSAVLKHKHPTLHGTVDLGLVVEVLFCKHRFPLMQQNWVLDVYQILIVIL
jgi:hypothetical protein